MLIFLMATNLFSKYEELFVSTKIDASTYVESTSVK
jgi:hypothetical protein